MSAPSTNYAQALLRPEVAELPLYDPGADPEMVKARYALSSIIKLSNNENPLGVSPKVAQLLASKVDLLGRYPDPASRALHQQLATRLAVSPEQMIIGNGSENILELLCQAFLSAGDRVLTQSPCFSLHEIFPRMMGASVEKIPHDPAFGIDIPAWVAALQKPVKMLLISNPSNPVGGIFNRAQFWALIDATSPQTLIVMDEAYYEYAIHDADYPDALIELGAQKRPWIVLRTFSKAYALAGLRIGYGIASDSSIVDALHRVRTPYNINFLAQEAAKVALDDLVHLDQSVAYIESERQRLTILLREAGFFVAPSHTNFLFIDTQSDAGAVAQRLQEEGIIVKAWREAGYESFLRVSIGLTHENQRFIEGLMDCCQPLMVCPRRQHIGAMPMIEQP